MCTVTRNIMLRRISGLPEGGRGTVKTLRKMGHVDAGDKTNAYKIFISKTLGDLGTDVGRTK